ncbi:MAG: helix-turn-helix transcriptional regulator [Peptococcaceae bacterium]|nr:helix-turn-helix transcriptional regulator [Peptococcaceae bacterium]
MRIEEQILYHLNKKGISKNKLAERAGISRSGLTNILSGKKSPTFDTLTKLCRAMDIEVEELFETAPVRESGAGEKRLLQYYRGNDDYGRGYILESAKAFYTVRSQKKEENPEEPAFPQPGPEDLPQEEAAGPAILIREPEELPWLSLEDACARVSAAGGEIQEGAVDFAIRCSRQTPYLFSAARVGQLVFFRPADAVGIGEIALLQTGKGRLALVHHSLKAAEKSGDLFAEKEEGRYIVPGCRILGRLIAVK